MNFLFTFFLIFSTQLFFFQKNNVSLTVETESNIYTTDKISICEYNSGFEVNIDKKFKQKIFDKKTKSIFLSYGMKKLKISLYNVLYSPKANVQNQTPLTPKGNIVIFKNETSFYFLIRSDNKSIIKKFLENKVDICE